MERMFLLAAAVLFATGTGMAGKGMYQEPEKASPAAPVAASKANPPRIPPFLTPVPMDTPAKPESPSILQLTAQSIRPTSPRPSSPGATTTLPPPCGGSKSFSASMRVPSRSGRKGEKMQIGELDTGLMGYVPPTLSPEQAAAHTWRPDAKTWEEIKKHSVQKPATVIVTGYSSQEDGQPLSTRTGYPANLEGPSGRADLLSRRSPAAASSRRPRSEASSSPCPTPCFPMIKWRLRYVSDRKARS